MPENSGEIKQTVKAISRLENIDKDWNQLTNNQQQEKLQRAIKELNTISEVIKKGETLKKEIVFDIIYETATRIFKDSNMCDIRKTKVGKKEIVSCVGYPSGSNGSKETLCCSSCNSNSWNNGCTTKSLGCKLHACGWLRDKYPDITRMLHLLKDIAISYNISCDVYMKKDKAISKSWND